MRAGRRNTYVTIQRNTPTQGDSGEEIDVWADHLTAWINLRATGGEENIGEYRGEMRYADVVHTDRVVWGSRIFDIVSVLDKGGLGRDLVLELREDTSG